MKRETEHREPNLGQEIDALTTLLGNAILDHAEELRVLRSAMREAGIRLPSDGERSSHRMRAAAGLAAQVRLRLKSSGLRGSKVLAATAKFFAARSKPTSPGSESPGAAVIQLFPRRDPKGDTDG